MELLSAFQTRMRAGPSNRTGLASVVLPLRANAVQAPPARDCSCRPEPDGTSRHWSAAGRLVRAPELSTAVRPAAPLTRSAPASALRRTRMFWSATVEVAVPG